MAPRVNASVPDDLSTSGLVAAATRYIADYEEKLTSVIADETSTQVIPEPRVGFGGPSSRISKSLKVTSELFFMFEPLERQWMAIRDVIAVDGVPVPDRPDLKDALRRLPASDVAATFKASNSRFNIGRIQRNFNEPTLALLVLDRKHVERFKFDRARGGAKGGLVILEFSEKERPTLIAGIKRGAAFSKGQIVVDPRSGAITRATLTVKADDVKVELETEYVQDTRLGMLVPKVFREQYEYDGRDYRDYELVRCETTYSNYRRFEVSSRIKNP